MDLRKLKTLVDLVSESNIAELEITEADGMVRIVKAGAPMVMGGTPMMMTAPAAMMPAPSASLASRRRKIDACRSALPPPPRRRQARRYPCGRSL